MRKRLRDAERRERKLLEHIVEQIEVFHALVNFVIGSGLTVPDELRDRALRMLAAGQVLREEEYGLK